MSQFSTKVTAAAVSLAQSTDVYATTKTAAWNGRDVSKVNVKAALQYGVAKIATLINKFLVSHFATSILESSASSDSLKNRAALVLTKHFDKPNAAQVINHIFANLPEATRHQVEGRIHHIDQEQDTWRLREAARDAATFGVPYYQHNTALDVYPYGQILRTNDPTNATVKTALVQILSA